MGVMRATEARERRKLLCRLEASTAATVACLAVVTVFWPEWIEAVLQIDPDGGTGWAEWLAVVCLCTISAALGLQARVGLRHLRTAVGVAR